MAINSSESVYDDTATESVDTSCSWKMNILSKKTGSFNNGSLTSSSSHRSKKQSKSMISPYLSDDRVKLLSRVTEKNMVHRNTTGFVSSFPLAANIYKANSDEFKITKQNNKKVKKSVLTLPNEPPLGQVCTVSDMNDSEYNETKNFRKPKPKKRRKNERYPKLNKNIEIYDRDAKYCSQLNINLDSSSTDMFKHLTGDGSRIIKRSKTNSYGRNQVIDNDVWAVLRNINKIQFIPSPPMSVDSKESLKKNRKAKKRSSDRKDTRFIETCRTEEYAYISYDSNSINSCSRSTSFDRVTVIGRQDEVKEMCSKIQDDHNEIARRGITTNQNIKRISRISTNNNKSNNIKDKQDKHLKSKMQTDSFSFHDDEREIRNCYDKNAYNKGQENIQKTECEQNKSIAETTTCINPDDHKDNSNEQNLLKMSSLKTVTEKASLTSVKERQDQLNGITRVVVSKGKDVEKCKQQTVIRKPRLVTTMPSSAGMPKLTQAAIKRRLANIKFPIIVTGKDQLSSHIQVPNCEPLQFAGLDKQVWPFMVNWLPQSNMANDAINQSKLSSVNTVNSYKSPEHKDFNKPSPERDMTITCKNNKNCMSLQDRVKDIPTKTRFVSDDAPLLDLSTAQKYKIRPMRQLKDKMLNLFYNRSSRLHDKMHSTSKESKDTKLYDANKNIDVNNQEITNKSINTYKSITIPKESFTGDSLKPGHMWAKARWASDFIENIITKIKCGVYYDEEYHRYSKYMEAEDRYTQTEKCVSSTNLERDVAKRDEKEIKDEYFDCKVIPGFEDSWQDLELETITKNQIAVKHCITNVVVQFDIALPFENHKILHQKQSISCVPIKVTESQTKIYKYKTSIMNAVLPAELCSILPKMLNNIFNSNPTPALPNVIDKVESPLTTIPELQNCNRHGGSINIYSPYLSLFLNTLKFQNGQFASSIPVSGAVIKAKKLNFINDRYSTLIINLIPKLDIRLLLDKIIYNPNVFINHKNKIVGSAFERVRNPNNCTALVPYVAMSINSGTVSSYNKMKSVIPNAVNSSIQINVGIFGTFILRQMMVGLLNNARENQITFVANKIDMNLLYENIQSIFSHNKALLFYEYEAKNIPSSHSNQHNFEGIRDKQQLKEPHKAQCKLIYSVNRKRSHIKLNKKCKSTSSISYYKKNTPLQRIANLDEFIQALGLAKDMASVIDGNAERKILSSIIEMKTWTTDITPRQALLILLLAIKKETSNLIRFRSVILQGIVMNRITKASDLDMEIEVIERENLNRLPQYEGISYLPASIENQDNLLEELCWIAKTTAADYQRSFDKSSERLLKSLLGKRKKLNPSYLRVMARYVGLGLLKSK